MAAPPISFFIRDIDPAGFIFNPPVSKQTPLPTNVKVGPWLPQTNSIKRGNSAEALPTACIIGKFFSNRLSPQIVFTDAPCNSARDLIDCSSSEGPISLVGVLIKSLVKASP